jgi:hypothetical protein
VVQDRDVVSHLREAGREIAFVPAWFARIESRRQEFGGVVQGDFHVRVLYTRFSPRSLFLSLAWISLQWNGGWPAGDNDINFDTDSYHLQYNPGPLYMASVSPWFFTVSRVALLAYTLTDAHALYPPKLALRDRFLQQELHLPWR